MVTNDETFFWALAHRFGAHRADIIERIHRWWRVAVEDNGTGVAPEDLERVFEEFQRVSPREDVHGTGLGLAITRRLARLLAGEVSVKSTPGEGSRFEVIVPRTLAQTPSPPDEPPRGEVSETRPPAHERRSRPVRP